MIWQEEFLNYQEAFDEARREKEQRQAAAQQYRAGVAYSEQLTRRLLEDALSPYMQEAFRYATKELARARVDEAVRELIENDVSTQKIEARLPLFPAEDIEVRFRRVLIELPRLCISVAMRD